MIKLKKIFITAVAVMISSQAIARDQIKIVGSSTVYPYTTVVAERFGKQGKFKTPVVESTGTGGGFKSFCGGVGVQHPDMTGASRGLTFAHSIKGQDANFTKAQLWKAIAHDVVVDGKLVKNPYKNWNEIDKSLPAIKIEILVAPPTSGTRDAWDDLIMSKGCDEAFKKLTDPKNCTKYREDAAVIEAGENDTLIVQKLGSSPNAFGYFGYSYLVANKDKIKAAKIDGIAPTIEGIQKYTYPVARPLFLYAKKAHASVIPGFKEFLTEYTGKTAVGSTGYLFKVGLVPNAKETEDKVRDVATKLVAMKN
ncbi:MAG: phosphate-binding protein [Alphaproteobacteria bacterium]|nr:phosphate-binding protein [Candidatus Fonsibacter sp. PEL55]